MIPKFSTPLRQYAILQFVSVYKAIFPVVLTIRSLFKYARKLRRLCIVVLC